jgi:HSP20 family protein
MTLIKWAPLRDLTTLQERMSHYMEDPFLKLPVAFEKGEGVEWVPSVDIFEKENALVLRAELPDMEMGDIDISVDGNMLQIKGNRKLAHEEKEENYHRIERVYGSFSRTFSIPDFVSLDKIEATYNRGMLTITMPKKEEVKPKKIKVEVKS